MKKRGLCLLLALGMTLGLCACSKEVRGRDSAEEAAAAACTALAAGDGEAYVALMPEDLGAAHGLTEAEMAKNIEKNTSSMMERRFGGTGTADVKVLSVQNLLGDELESIQGAFFEEHKLNIDGCATVECEVTVNGKTDTMSAWTVCIGERWYAISD